MTDPVVLNEAGEADINLADILIKALHPGIFTKGNDIKIFISRCTRYFEASGIHKSMRSILVIGLINKDLRDMHESTENIGLQSFEDRMRKAFSRSQTLIQDMERAFNFRRNK